MSEVLKNMAKVKLEAVPGTREADMSTAKAVYSEGDVLVATPEFKKREFTPLSNYSGNKIVELIAAWGKLPMKLSRPLPIDNTDHDGSDLDILLQCSGLARAPIYQTPGDDQTPLVGYRYTPDTYSTATASVDIVGAARRFESHGAKADLSVSAKVGDVVMIDFDLNSAFDAMVEGANTVPFVSPPAAAMIDDADEYGNVQIGGARFGADEVMFAMGADIASIETFDAHRFRMKEYDPTLGIKGYLDATNTYSISEALDGTEKTFRMEVKDPDDLSDAQDPTTGAIKWVIGADVMRLADAPTPSDKEGLYYLDKTFRLLPTAGDDNFFVEVYL